MDVDLEVRMKIKNLKTKIRTNFKHIIIFILLYTLLLLPYLISSTNTIPSADDFTFANAINEYRIQSGNFFLALCKFVKSRWFSWSGRWMFAIFPAGLNPLVVSNAPFKMLEIEMAISFLIFVLSFATLTNSILKCIFKVRKIKIRNFFILLLLFAMLNTDIYSEIFYWHTGVNYVFMISSELLTFALMIQYFNNNQKKWITVLFVMTGFYACNALQAIVPVLLLYVMVLYHKYKEKEIKKRDYIILMIFLLSTMLSICAPGNFARHSVIDSTGIHFFKAVIYTCNNLITLSIKLLSNPVVIGLIAVFFCLGIEHFFKKGRFDVNLFNVCIIFSMLMFGMMFPVSLGYSSSLIPNRVFFIFTVHFLMSACIIVTLLGNHFAKHMQRLRKNKCCVYIILALFFINNLFLNKWFQQSPYYVITENIYNDELIHDKWVALLSALESNQETVVQIDSSAIVSSPVLKDVGLSTDASSWINQAIDKYYGKESVEVISK